MTGTLVSDVSGGVSYIRGVAGDHAGIFKKKPYNSNAWIPMVATQTKGGGGWAIGNYNNEELEFVYGTKANIDADNNSTVMINFTAAGGANFPSTITQNGTAVSLNGHTHSYAPKTWTLIKKWNGTATQTWSKGSYKEFILECGYSTTYWTAICVPADVIGDDLREFYLGGGITSATNVGSGRVATLKVSSTKASANLALIDGTNRTANVTWRIYGR